VITCSACGQTNEADARFCTRCDRPLDWDGKRAAGQPTSAVAAVLTSRTIEVKPGQDATCELRVRNLGTVVDQFRFEVSGPLSGWCTVEPAVLRLFRKASGAGQLVFRLPRCPEARAGPSTFEVTASSTVVEEDGVRLGFRVHCAATNRH
jgi:hypothetical protein